MIDLKTLNRELDIINSEGPILALYESPNKTPYLKSRLTNGEGYIYFIVDEDLLNKYANSEITLDSLYESSPNSKVIFQNSNSAKEFSKSDYLGKLVLGGAVLSNLTEGMVSRKFQQDYCS